MGRIVEDVHGGGFCRGWLNKLYISAHPLRSTIMYSPINLGPNDIKSSIANHVKTT